MNPIVLVLVLVLETKGRIEDEEHEGAVHGKPTFVFSHALGP